jgi:hypothetical protein
VSAKDGTYLEARPSADNMRHQQECPFRIAQRNIECPDHVCSAPNSRYWIRGVTGTCPHRKNRKPGPVRSRPSSVLGWSSFPASSRRALRGWARWQPISLKATCPFGLRARCRCSPDCSLSPFTSTGRARPVKQEERKMPRKWERRAAVGLYWLRFRNHRKGERTPAYDPRHQRLEQ